MRKSPTPIDVEIAARLRLRRKELRMSQEKLGDAVGVTFQQIQKYEKGVNRIGGGNLAVIARALEVPIGYFFKDVDETDGFSSPSFAGGKMLRIGGATELLQAYARIEDSKRRKLILDLARSLAEESEQRAPQPVRSAIRHSRARPK